MRYPCTCIESSADLVARSASIFFGRCVLRDVYPFHISHDAFTSHKFTYPHSLVRSLQPSPPRLALSPIRILHPARCPLHHKYPEAGDSVQGYLAYEKQRPPRALQSAYAQGPRVVLGGGAVSYERVTPVRCRAIAIVKWLQLLPESDPSPLNGGCRGTLS